MAIPILYPFDSAQLAVFARNIGEKKQYSTNLYLPLRDSKGLKGLSKRLEKSFDKSSFRWNPTHDDGRGFVLRANDSGYTPFMTVAECLNTEGGSIGKVVVMGECGAEPRFFRDVSAFIEEMSAFQAAITCYANAGIEGAFLKSRRKSKSEKKLTVSLDCL